MAKQVKPAPVNETITAEMMAQAPEGGGTLPEAVPEDGVTLSEAVRAGVEAGKGPDNQIIVVGPKGGRWRAGRHFTSAPTIIDVADLTEEEGLALISDPKLVVGPAFPNIEP